MTDESTQGIGGWIDTLGDYVWFTVVITVTFVVVIAPSRLLEGEADSWVEAGLGFLGICFWAAAVWAIADATVGVAP